MINSSALSSASMQVEAPMPARSATRPYTHAARADRHLCGAGRAGFNLARCRGQSRRCWAADGVILRCRWPAQGRCLAGADGSASARVPPMCATPPGPGGGWLAAEGAERRAADLWLG